MKLTDYFRSIRGLIEKENFDELKDIKPIKPTYFNWVSDVFEPLNVNESPDAIALIWRNVEQEEKVSFKQVSQKANQFLNFLRKHGMKSGYQMYSQLPLITANWYSYLACIKGGIIITPAPTILAKRDIVYRLQTLQPEIAVSDYENAEKIDEAEEEIDTKIKLKIVTDKPREGWHFIEEVYKEATEAEAAKTKPDDALFHFFTSGTTGMPKVVVHTHLTYPLGHLTTASWIGMRKGDVHYNISQPGWAKFFWSSFFAPWSMGATVLGYTSDRFNAAEQLKMMETYEVSTFCAPPTVLRMFILEDLKSYNLKLRQCVAAGEPLNPEIIEKWKQGTGLTIRDGYGQTESTALLGNLPFAKLKYGSMGVPTFLYDVVLADDEGNLVGVSVEGNICVRTDEQTVDGIFLDYKNESDKKKASFKNGLYYTGDKAYKDAEGYFWFIGRDDDVIKASDFRVGPFEVESVLLEHEAVMEAAVVASPHKLRGNAVKGFVILKKGFSADQDLAETLFQHTEAHLTRYKIPRIIEFVEELPKTISGKIRRVDLRKQEEQSKLDKLKNALEFFHSKY